MNKSANGPSPERMFLFGLVFIFVAIMHGLIYPDLVEYHKDKNHRVALKEMKAEFSQIPPLPGSKEYNYSDFSKEGGARVSSHFISDQEYAQVRKYYHQELIQKEWEWIEPNRYRK